MPEKRSVDRRDFLKSAAVTGAAALDFTQARAPVPAATPAPPTPPPAQATAPTPARETDPPANVEVLTTDRPGGDFMVDVIKSLDFEYVAANPGSSFRGIHESIVNYGSNTAPEFITCLHEESSVAMAHGYFKAEGKPMAVLCHGTVGIQHAAMAIYNAYCDRVPVYIMAGNSLDATLRRPGVEWAHSVQDAAAMVRDFIKWDDLPISLPHFAESAVRAYKIAMTPPMMPVLLVLDGGLQEDPIASEIGVAPSRAEADTRLGSARRLGCGRRGGEAAGRRAGSCDRGRSRRPHTGRHRQARRAGRDAASPRRQSGRAHELPHEASAQSERECPAARRQRRRDPRPRADRLLGHGERGARFARAHVEVDREARNQADQHHRARSCDERQLPGLSALPGSRHRDGGGCRGHAARADGGVQAARHRRSPHRVRRSRETAGRGACGGAGACTRGRRVRMGRHADQYRLA